MRRHHLLLLVVLALAASSCSTHLGLGEAECSPPTGEASASNIMTVQAVPNAKYTPCLHELRLGWDSVEWFAENGRAGIEIAKDLDPFLTAVVTDSCDITDAVAVEGPQDDIQRFEDIESRQTNIEVVIVPSGLRPLGTAQEVFDELRGIQIDDRPVTYTIDAAINDPVAPRVESALAREAFVWIIDELDVEEGTVQLRSRFPTATGLVLESEDALDLIEDVAPEVFYRGDWYFTFDGGCITYSFDAEGLLAETIAADADDALGFYPAFELRNFATSAGFDLG